MVELVVRFPSGHQVVLAVIDAHSDSEPVTVQLRYPSDDIKIERERGTDCPYCEGMSSPDAEECVPCGGTFYIVFADDLDERRFWDVYNARHVYGD